VTTSAEGALLRFAGPRRAGRASIADAERAGNRRTAPPSHHATSASIGAASRAASVATLACAFRHRRIDPVGDPTRQRKAARVDRSAEASA
jgi:hypothetical protein